MTDPVASLTIRPQTALDAYQRTEAGGSAGDLTSFGAVMQRAVQGAIDLGQDAEQKSLGAIAGTANLTDVVTAVSNAQLALQTTVAIRDKMVSAYQTIMNMSV